MSKLHTAEIYQASSLDDSSGLSKAINSKTAYGTLLKTWDMDTIELYEEFKYCC